uniref:UDP-galactose translocator n=1 Tax=Syphacia muris TaxID=451379 RepID=A0A0N5ADV1_9BILA
MGVKLERDASSRRAHALRTGILIWLTFQNSVHTLLIRYSRARDVPHLFLPSVAVFFTEVFKIISCLLVICYEEQSMLRALKLVKKQVFENVYDTLKVCLPAFIYTVQNNLFYLAATHLEAATFMVCLELTLLLQSMLATVTINATYNITSQLKILTTAVFTVIILGKSLTRIQWVSIAALFAGVSLVQLQNSSSKRTGTVEQKPIVGFCAVVVASILSGFAGIYFEKILKGAAPVSLWMRNVQMAVFALPSSLITSLTQANNDWRVIKREGMLYGFDYVVWITVFWYCIGGLSVAVCIRYANNIAKNFATSVAIIISTIGSVYIFGFVPDLLFVLGATLVIGSIFLYSSSNTSFECLRRKRIFLF